MSFEKAHPLCTSHSEECNYTADSCHLLWRLVGIPFLLSSLVIKYTPFPAKHSEKMNLTTSASSSLITISPASFL